MPPLRLSYVIDGKVFVATVEVNDEPPRRNLDLGGRPSSSVSGSPFSRPSSPHSPSRQATSPGNDDIPAPQEPASPSAVEPLSEDQVEALFCSLDAAMEDGDVGRVLALIRCAQAQQRADIDEGLGCVKRRLERLMHCGA